MSAPLAATPLVRATADILAGRPPVLQGVPLEALGASLERHGLAGLTVAEARERSASGGIYGIPRALDDRLLATYHRVALHTTLVVESAHRAVATLEAAEVPVLIFKGVALHLSGTYRDPGARALEDTDLLVRAEDADRAVRALRESGFEPWIPWDPARVDWLSSFSFSDEEAPGGLSPAIDLHWATPYRRLRLAGPWAADPLWSGAVAPLPAPEPHFALMAEHVLKHLRVVVHSRGIGDLVRLLPSLQDGDALTRQARIRRTLPGLRLMLAFLREGLGIPLPDTIADSVGVPSRFPPGLSERLGIERLLAPDRPVEGRGQGILGDWLLLGSRLDSARELARVVVPSGRWLRARYGAGGGRLQRRARYVADLFEWSRGRAPSPLAPNQEFEG